MTNFLIGYICGFATMFLIYLYNSNTIGFDDIHFKFTPKPPKNNKKNFADNINFRYASYHFNQPIIDNTDINNPPNGE